LDEHRCDFFVEICTVKMSDKLVSSAQRIGLELLPNILDHLYKKRKSSGPSMDP
jgi:hypothetical protein